MTRSRRRSQPARHQQSRRSACATAAANTSARIPPTSTTWNTSLPVRKLHPKASLPQLAHVSPDPVKYETLIRRFQTRDERDAEAQKKGYSRVLEGDLLRSEAKLAALKATLPGEDGDGEDTAASLQGDGEGPAAPLQGDGEDPGSVDADDDNGDPTTKEEGRELWNEILTGRFVRGEDPDFDYSGVDDDEGLDAMERQDAQDAWFDEEDPGWASGDEAVVEVPRGETGVQDY